jgi:hypothetical protein
MRPVEDSGSIRKLLDPLDRLTPTADPNSLPEPRPRLRPSRSIHSDRRAVPALLPFADAAGFRSPSAWNAPYSTATCAESHHHPAGFAPSGSTTSTRQCAIGLQFIGMGVTYAPNTESRGQLTRRPWRGWRRQALRRHRGDGGLSRRAGLRSLPPVLAAIRTCLWQRSAWPATGSSTCCT